MHDVLKMLEQKIKKMFKKVDEKYKAVLFSINWHKSSLTVLLSLPLCS